MFGRECRREGTRNRALVFLARIEILSRRQNPHPSKTAKGGAARCLQALPHGTKNAATDGPGYRATPRSTTEPHRGWMSDTYLLHLHAEGEKCFLLTSPFIELRPERASLAVAIQMLKQIVSYQLHKLAAGGPFWQARYYDFNVWSERKRIEKLRYIHRNPVKRGLVESPEPA